MSNVVVSLSNNLLRASFYGEEGFGTASVPIAKDIVEKTRVLDIGKFSEVLSNLISQVISPKAKDVRLNFLLEPQDVVLEFVAVPKNGGDVEEQVLSIVSERLGTGIVIENLYFSYQKIAPFVYQFVGVEKKLLEKYLEVATNVNIPLQSVVPWVMLLPKLVNDSKPSVFVFKDNDTQVVALAELNGIYFANSYEKEKSQEELQELVQQLSVYKRVVPIDTIYTVNCDSFSIDSKYQVLPLDMLADNLENAREYEAHLLFNDVTAKEPSLLRTHVNLLNLLPVPVVEKIKFPMVPVGAVVGGLLVFGLVGYLVFFRNPPKNVENSSLAMDSTPANVLSEASEVPEATPSEEVELNRKDLKIKVENGSGVAGAAGRTQTFLEDLGYDVLSIGDAEESDRISTLVSLKSDKTTYKDLLVGDLKARFDTVVIEEGLDEGLEYDALVVVGVEKESE